MADTDERTAALRIVSEHAVPGGVRQPRPRLTHGERGCGRQRAERIGGLGAQRGCRNRSSEDCGEKTVHARCEWKNRAEVLRSLGAGSTL